MIYKFLPYKIFCLLFGDRRKFGTQAVPDDPDFLRWKQNYMRFYLETQKGTIGRVVNHFGFRIMRNMNLTGKSILEIGPGIIEHMQYTSTKPEKYILCDTNREMLIKSEEILRKKDIPIVRSIEVKGVDIPLADNEVDVIITFHQLEHVHNLERHLKEIKRVLKPNGTLVGSVPAEGGFAWGFGRFLTSRRYAKRVLKVHYDKIICWEHPNFVDKIRKALNQEFSHVESVKKPFSFLPLDMNLSFSFIYKNDKKLCG